MKTTDLIFMLVRSLEEYGDLPIVMIDNKQLDIGWYCPTEGGLPKEIVFDSVENMEVTDCSKE